MKTSLKERREERLSFRNGEKEEQRKRSESKLKDKFALAALTGLCANPNGYAGAWDIVVKDAYNAADAMMKERGNHE